MWGTRRKPGAEPWSAPAFFSAPKHSPQDLAEVVWAHRLVMDPDAEFAGATAADVVTRALADVPVPSTRS